MTIIHSPDCLNYSQPGHPESPGRVSSIVELIKDDYQFITPTAASDEVILETHTALLLESIRAGSFNDPDTPTYPNIHHLAKLAVGAAVRAMECALAGESAFSLMRPPGHHAGKDCLSGFCYLNNIAIAVTQALKCLDKVAIIDFDCHHGDGTEDIFFGNERVLYVSTHESPLFPGTGLATQGNCLNYPLPAGTTESDYLPVFESALERVGEFNPDLIAVSAGFDSHKGQPIANMLFETETFGTIAKMITELRKPTFSVLEGGYCDQLAASVREYLRNIEL